MGCGRLKEHLKKTLRNLLEVLDRDKVVTLEWVAQDAFGLRMRLAINELDVELGGVLRTGRERHAYEERGCLMAPGASRMVKLTSDPHPTYTAPTWTLAHNPKTAAPVVSRVLGRGRITHSRRIAQSL